MIWKRPLDYSRKAVLDGHQPEQRRVFLRAAADVQKDAGSGKYDLGKVFCRQVLLGKKVRNQATEQKSIADLDLMNEAHLGTRRIDPSPGFVQ